MGNLGHNPAHFLRESPPLELRFLRRTISITTLLKSSSRSRVRFTQSAKALQKYRHEQPLKSIDWIQVPTSPFIRSKIYFLSSSKIVWLIALNRVQVLIPYDYRIKTALGGDDISNDDSQIQVYHTEWKMTIYVYATDASPVGQTAENYKGTVYTYVVHDGMHQRASGSPGRSYGSTSYGHNASRSWGYYFVDILGYNFQDKGGLLSKVTQQPNDNIYDHRDNMFLCKCSIDIDLTKSFDLRFVLFLMVDNISQEQRMTLFRASQKQTWEFVANYQKPCAWNRFQMHRDAPNWNDAGYVLSYNDYYVGGIRYRASRNF